MKKPLSFSQVLKAFCSGSQSGRPRFFADWYECMLLNEPQPGYVALVRVRTRKH